MLILILLSGQTLWLPPYKKSCCFLLCSSVSRYFFKYLMYQFLYNSFMKIVLLDFSRWRVEKSHVESALYTAPQIHHELDAAVIRNTTEHLERMPATTALVSCMVSYALSLVKPFLEINQWQVFRSLMLMLLRIPKLFLVNECFKWLAHSLSSFTLVT